jgi:hypothetical protein
VLLYCYPKNFLPSLPAKLIYCSRRPRRQKPIYKKKGELRADFFTHCGSLSITNLACAYVRARAYACARVCSRVCAGVRVCVFHFTPITARVLLCTMDNQLTGPTLLTFATPIGHCVHIDRNPVDAPRQFETAREVGSSREAPKRTAGQIHKDFRIEAQRSRTEVGRREVGSTPTSILSGLVVCATTTAHPM